jgi:hypothetical protein
VSGRADGYLLLAQVKQTLQLVQALSTDIEHGDDTELSPVIDVDATGSDSGDAGDW